MLKQYDTQKIEEFLLLRWMLVQEWSAYWNSLFIMLQGISVQGLLVGKRIIKAGSANAHHFQ